MNQSQYDQLAEAYIGRALQMKADEKIWLEYQGKDSKPLADACLAAVQKRGCAAHVVESGSEYLNKLMAHATDEQLRTIDMRDLNIMKTMDCYIRIGDVGDEDLITVSTEDMMRYGSLGSHEKTRYRVASTRWLVVRAPTGAFAKACNMDLPAFESFYADACLFDYAKMKAPAEALTNILRNGRDVRIIGKDTELTFSIAGVNAMPCVGDLNIPDGECFTAPVKGTVEGRVLYGPSVYAGKKFTKIHLAYSAGKIIEAKGGSEEETINLNKILDTDAGARYPGEFAIAFHPLIEKPVGEILFDEKIKGSFHIASGACYKGWADNGNESAVHWDMVQIQTPEHGGGEIWIDGRLIRKNGVFVVPELEGLNPDKLLGK